VLLPTSVIHALFLNAGIVGGFAPPTPTATHSITKESSSDDLVISSALRKEHQPGLESQPEQQTSAAEVLGLVDELHTILVDLPTLEALIEITYNVPYRQVSYNVPYGLASHTS
jgi:hypothetical protein